jgi:PAS domain S-box-containing protein
MWNMREPISNGSIKMNHLGTLEQTDFYRLLVNSIQDYAIFLLDTSGIVSTWNIGAQKLKGYTPEEIIGKHFSVFYPREDQLADKPAKKLEACRKLGHVEDEGWRVRKDGTRFWANVVITALRDKTGEIIGFAKVTRDLTERKRHEDAMALANEQLEIQRSELEQLNQAKDEFISLASHQLRTPASGVKQFLGLLREGYAGDLDDLQKEFIERAYEGNNRQLELVNDLLRVAQVDAGKVTLIKDTADLAAVIKDVLSEQQASFEERKQTVVIEGLNHPLKAKIDKARLRMVIENIVNNASKYTPVGGTITVNAAKHNQTIRISVADTGVGIPKSAQPKLFSKFSRIPNELSDVVGGSGLGLYWAHKIIELHDGKIEVASKSGKGSVFTIVVPVK